MALSQNKEEKIAPEGEQVQAVAASVKQMYPEMNTIVEKEAKERLRVLEESRRAQYHNQEGEGEKEKELDQPQLQIQPPVSSLALTPVDLPPRTPTSVLFDTITETEEGEDSSESSSKEEIEAPVPVPAPATRVGWVVDNHGNSKLGLLPVSSEKGEGEESIASWAQVSEKDQEDKTAAATPGPGGARRRDSRQLDSARSLCSRLAALAPRQPTGTRREDDTEQHQIRRREGVHGHR